MTFTEMTICFLLRREPRAEILLALKKNGFGAGKITGVGGKVEAGESIVSAAARELAEETSVQVQPEHLTQVAELTFLFPARPAWDCRVHVFQALTWNGEPQESAEVTPAWFALDELPFDSMWDDARYWLPWILEGQPIQAEFVFRDDNTLVDHYQIERINE